MHLSRNHNLRTSQAPLKNQVQGTSLFTSAVYLRHLQANWPLHHNYASFLQLYPLSFHICLSASMSLSFSVFSQRLQVGRKAHSRPRPMA